MKQSERHAAATYKSFVEDIKAFSPRGQMNLEGVRLYADAMKFLGTPIPGDVDSYVDQTPARKAFGH
jgi:hypothetical protein